MLLKLPRKVSIDRHIDLPQINCCVILQHSVLSACEVFFIRRVLYARAYEDEPGRAECVRAIMMLHGIVCHSSIET